MTELLQPEDLDAFEPRLRALDVPVVRYLRQGLSPSEMDRIEARLGFRLPGEVRVWFGWHDGVDLAPWPTEQTLGGLQLLTLEDSIEICRRNRDIALEVADGDEARADTTRKARWLSIAAPVYAADVAIECSGAADAPVPVYFVDWQDPQQAAAPKCASMKDLVGRWSSGLERGSWKWNPGKRDWDIRGGDDAVALLGGA